MPVEIKEAPNENIYHLIQKPNEKVYWFVKDDKKWK